MSCVLFLAYQKEKKKKVFPAVTPEWPPYISHWFCLIRAGLEQITKKPELPMKVVTFYLSNKIKNYMTYCPGFGQQLATTQLVCNN